MRRRTPDQATLLSVAVGLLVLGGCSGAPDAGTSEGPEPIGTASSAILSNDAIARAEEWVTAQLPYCQAANHKPDSDTSCASTCTRPDNADWDPYRSDCSGLVSWAWGLPPPGRTTAEFAPAVTDITSTIQASDLRPGDAINIPHDHVMLFKEWLVAGQRARFIEEPGCSAAQPYAREIDADVTLSGTSISVLGKTYDAIRYASLESSPDGGADAAIPQADSGTRPADAGDPSARDSAVPPASPDTGAPPDSDAGEPSYAWTGYGPNRGAGGCSTSPFGADAPGDAGTVLLALFALCRRARRRVSSERD